MVPDGFCPTCGEPLSLDFLGKLPPKCWHCGAAKPVSTPMRPTGADYRRQHAIDLRRQNGGL